MKINKTIISIVIVALILGGLVYIYFTKTKNIESASSPSEIISSQELKNIKTLEVGQKAPDFDVTTVDGEKLSLDSFNNKILVVTSGAAWYPTCWLEAQKMRPVYDEFKNRGVDFMTVDMDQRDDEKSVMTFQTQYAPWHNVYIGNATEMINDYGFWHFEITYIVKYGIIEFADTQITDTRVLSSEINKLI